MQSLEKVLRAEAVHLPDGREHEARVVRSTFEASPGLPAVEMTRWVIDAPPYVVRIESSSPFEFHVELQSCREG